MTGSLVANEAAAPIVRTTFGKSLIDSSQVQVDSIMQVVRQSPILHGNEAENTPETCASKCQEVPVVVLPYQTGCALVPVSCNRNAPSPPWNPPGQWRTFDTLLPMISLNRLQRLSQLIASAIRIHVPYLLLQIHPLGGFCGIEWNSLCFKGKAVVCQLMLCIITSVSSSSKIMTKCRCWKKWIFHTILSPLIWAYFPILQM